MKPFRCVLAILFVLNFPLVTNAVTCRSIFQPVEEAAVYKFQLFSTEIYKQLAQKIVSFETYALREYGERGSGTDENALVILGKLRKLGPEFEQLLLDPGLIQRLAAFIEFVEKNPTSDPWVARDDFGRRGVNQKTVYRGLSLTEEEAASILKDGMRSTFLRKLDTRPMDEELQFRKLTGDLRDNLGAHEELASPSTFMSVTEYIEIAAQIPAEFTKDNTKIYVFEIKISELELVTLDKDNGIWSQGYISKRKIKLSNALDGVRTFDSDRKVESFVFYQIPASAIKEITPPANSEYSLF